MIFTLIFCFDRSTLLAYHVHLSRKNGLLTEGRRRVRRVKLHGCLEGWRAEVRRRGAKRKLLDLVDSWRRRAVLGAGLKGVNRPQRCDLALKVISLCDLMEQTEF